ncbi:MBL fold metallo-hydrolase [Asticcacaulis sp.]|uniref:MBL fold metallo-hydrolase n=1 Tax=Asticcacaulis sp. TaxID=1872648 RepID=UPI002CD47173|nr:MBL fold metallo-hydrolase [Asticcacaulis sp.]HTM82875.1 MBL fold metallo-hydrolase [Asticcacaulis sp.]
MPRNTLKKLAFSALILSGALMEGVPLQQAYAAAPMVRTQAPGYYRLMLGAFEITALSDGTDDLPVDQLLTNTTKAKTDLALHNAFEASPLETSVNAFLINTGTRLILVDTGAGAMFGPTLGKLISNLKAAGYQPEQIDEALITHLHPDHVGGLVSDGKASFPNAQVFVSKADADFWLSKANLDAAPESSKVFFTDAVSAVAPYIAAQHFSIFDGSTEIAPGIRTVSLPGHSPGQTGYAVESQGQKLLIWGDVVHVEAVQFDDPSVTIAYDASPETAEAERNKQFQKAASEGYLVASAHLAFPGFGHVRASGKAFQWVPVNYSRLPE